MPLHVPSAGVPAGLAPPPAPKMSEYEHIFGTCITSHSWNGDRSLLAICPNDSTVRNRARAPVGPWLGRGHLSPRGLFFAAFSQRLA